MRYLSVCSGIEAATVAWHPLGWTPAAFAEIDKFPRAVLTHHYRHVPLHGDFTTIKGDEYGPIDILVGGTPCQDFSFAGLRAGIAGERGNLTLDFLLLAKRTRPRWLVWENVPGILSSDERRAFGAVLGGLAELGYGFAYRVLDAQHFGLAQRRARVFVVGHLGDWRRAAAVLFERESLQGHPAPRREAGERVAPTIAARTKGGGGLGTDFDCDGGLIANAIHASDSVHAVRRDADNLVMSSGQANAEISRDQCPTLTLLHEAPILAHSLRADGFDASEDGTGRGTPLVEPHTFDWQAGGGGNDKSFKGKSRSYIVDKPGRTRALTAAKTLAIAFSVKEHGADAGPISQVTSKANRSNPQPGDPCHPLAAGAHPPAVAWSIMPQNSGRDYKARPVDVSQPVMAGGPVGGNQGGDYIQRAMQVRRLTPRECERLQGFPDNYTDIPWRGKNWTPDGPRYKALGNSMAVPVMRWIGERIVMVEAMTEATAA